MSDNNIFIMPNNLDNDVALNSFVFLYEYFSQYVCRCLNLSLDGFHQLITHLIFSLLMSL